VLAAKRLAGVAMNVDFLGVFTAQVAGILLSLTTVMLGGVLLALAVAEWSRRECASAEALALEPALVPLRQRPLPLRSMRRQASAPSRAPPTFSQHRGMLIARDNPRE
jgi:hypothetical protein